MQGCSREVQREVIIINKLTNTNYEKSCDGKKCDKTLRANQEGILIKVIMKKQQDTTMALLPTVISQSIATGLFITE